MTPLTVPMKEVMRLLSMNQNPHILYLHGQLRMIYQGLYNRGLIQRYEGAHYLTPPTLTPAGRNYITALKRENGNDDN